MKRWSWMGSVLALVVLVGAAPALADDDASTSYFDQYGGHGRDGYRYEGYRYHYDNEFRLRLGQFTPDGNERYWNDVENEFNGRASDLADASFGADWLYDFGPNVAFILSGDYFEGKSDMSYRDFTDAQGREIVHTTTLDVAPVTAGILVRVAPPDLPVQPYVGAGAGMYFWRLEETGDFIDFNNNNQIFTDSFRDSGSAFGYYGLVGIEVPISRNFSVFGQARWDKSSDDLSGDFAGLGKLDLSGRRVEGGLSWRF